MDRDGSTLAGRVQAADRKYERAGSSREKERSAFCKFGEMGLAGFCEAGWWSFGGRLFGIEKNFCLCRLPLVNKLKARKPSSWSPLRTFAKYV